MASRFIRKSLITGIALVTALSGLFVVCTKDNPVTPTITDTWKITGTVADGYAGKSLDSAVVTYSDRDGNSKTVTAGAQGYFTCTNLPYGSVTLTVKYSLGTTRYTTSILSINSGTKENALTDTIGKQWKFRDTTVAVKLFAIVASVSGTVQAQKHARAVPVAAPATQVQVTFGEDETMSPRTFTSVTDANGLFTIDSLPLASGAVITVLGTKVGGIDYLEKPVNDRTLIKGRLGIGNILLDKPVTEEDPATAFRLLYTSFPTGVIRPNETMSFTYSAKPDSVASFATIQTVKVLGAVKSAAVNNVNISVENNVFKVTPITSLISGDSVVVTINVYGENGGYQEYTDTVKAVSASTADVIASNVLTASKEGVSGLGLTDSMYFNFVADLQQATASVTHGSPAVVDLVTTTVVGKQILIKPKGSWLAGIQYTVKVNGTLNDGTPVSFTVKVTTEGGLTIISSNAFTLTGVTPPYAGKNGFIISDTLTITANKILSSVSATLVDTLTGAQISVSIPPVTGVMAKIAPQQNLKFATSYRLSFTIATANGEAVSGTAKFMTTSSNFYMESSNACVGGDVSKPVQEFDPAAPIQVIMSDTAASATATLMTVASTPVPIPVVVSAAGKIITISPTVPPLEQNTKYTLSVSAQNKKSVTTSIKIDSIITRTALFVEWSNARIGNNATQPVLNFDPLDNIIIVMSKPLAKATARLQGTSTDLAKVTILGTDTIVIDPQLALTESTPCSLFVYAEDLDGNKYSGAPFVKGLTPVRGVYIVASNVLTQDGADLKNVPITTAPWFKMSVPAVAASIKATVSGATSGAIDNVVTVRGDTIVITPVASYKYDEVVTVSFSGMATNGKYIDQTAGNVKTFTTEPAKSIRVISSNVLNANGDGLTNVSVTENIKVVLSSTPKAGSITKADVTGAIGNAVITVSGDTVIIDPVTNLAYGTPYAFTLTGLDVNGNTFTAVRVPAALTFQTSQNVFVVASNMIDANGAPLQTFARYGTMWIKFSELLSTDKTTYTWASFTNANGLKLSSAALASGGTQINGDGQVATTPNAILRISGDTLFVTPDNRAAIGYGAQVGFDVTVTTATGKTATFGASVKTAPLNLYTKATNTLDANGTRRQDFGLRDTVWVVSSVQVDSIVQAVDNFTAIAGVQTPDDVAGTLRNRVWLAATGDTIFYAPSAKLSANSLYGLKFQLHLKGDAVGSYTAATVLPISWKTKAGVLVSAMNVMANSTTFRPFKVIGDSLVVTFTKAIDTSFNAPIPFAVNGYVAHVTKTWSSDLKTVTIKNIDTLAGRPYTINMADLTTNNTTYQYAPTFNLTCADGEERSGATVVKGENLYVGKLAIKTEYALALVGSNTINGHTTPDTISATSDVAKDTFALAGTPTLVFNRAVDATKINADVTNQYLHYLKLVVNGSTVPLQFTLAISADAKTLTLTPLASFVAGVKYDIIVTNIPAAGLNAAASFVGTGRVVAPAGAIDKSIISAYDFKAKPNADTLITALLDTVRVDTVAAIDNRYGYSAGTAAELAGAGIQADGKFNINIKKAQWGPHYADSVSGYEVRIKNQPHGVTWGDWKRLNTKLSAGSAYNAFSATKNTSDAWTGNTPIDVTVGADNAIYTALQVAKNGTGGYSNDNSMLENGTVVALEVRAFKAYDGAAALSDTSFAAWSDSITFRDAVAPCDSNFADWVFAGLRHNIASFTPDFTAVKNRTALGADTSDYIDVTFPEDMDVTSATVPTITFYYDVLGVEPGIAAKSRWTSARNYRIYLILAAATRYDLAGWYYKVSVAGMKDYSGNTIQTTGTVPAPAPVSGTSTYATMGVGTPPTYGSRQIANTAVPAPAKPGYYVY